MNFMKMFKQFALCVLAAAISGYAYADVVELDAYNPDHCRQQILKSTDEIPVIATYTSDTNDGNSQSFMKKFDLLVKAHPERTFFTWDAKKDIFHLTQTLCLQQLGFFVPPNIILLGVFKDDESGKAIMTSPFRLEWAGEMTMAQMETFIDVSGSSLKRSMQLQKKSS